LDKATIGEVQNFFEEYYAPNNAVLAIVGDLTIAEGFRLAEKYFDSIPARKVPPRPEVGERPQTAERRSEESDQLAQVPALAIGYRMPPHGSHETIVAAVTGELLHNGDASLL
jgi:zinc protease